MDGWERNGRNGKGDVYTAKPTNPTNWPRGVAREWAVYNASQTRVRQWERKTGEHTHTHSNAADRNMVCCKYVCMCSLSNRSRNKTHTSYIM
jgi:hypothetical protein